MIYIRAGSKTSPFDQRPEENKDDFEVKTYACFWLTELKYGIRPTLKRKQIKMGDSTGKSESIGFHFELKPEHLTAKAYEWDTTRISDGASSRSNRWSRAVNGQSHGGQYATSYQANRGRRQNLSW